MRKIYSPPFNKFAIFVLYGLLSIAVITLAQGGNEASLKCEPMGNPPAIVIGYVQLFTDQPSEPKKIPWELYDYINVIAYPDGDDSVWNSVYPPDPDPDPNPNPNDENADDPLKKIKELIKDKNAMKPLVKTQILLSIRNYDPKKWPGDEEYPKFIAETVKTINQLGLNGVDIEYPGMRGTLCRDGYPGGPILWNKEERDVNFANMLVTLRTEMVKGKGKGKIIMLTVGKDTVAGLNDKIDYLNIETNHYSLYANLKNYDRTPNITSYPNAPLPEFKAAYDAWTAAGVGIDNNKIIMGVDFGNTFQVVSNSEITTSPKVSFAPPQDNIKNPDGTNIPGLKKINGLCPSPLDGKLNLYSLPDLIFSCDNNVIPGGWTYMFDDGDSFTPWLYREDNFVPPGNPNNYQYISYENHPSLSEKLNSATIKGMSIFDISYDGDGSLLRSIRNGKSASTSDGKDGTGGTGGAGGAGGAGKSPPSSPTDPNNTTNTPPLGNNNRGGVIAGAVIGSLFGSIIILGAGLWYRNRDRPKSSSFKSLLNFKAIPSSIRNHSNSRDTEMTSDPSPNHRFAVPSTTAVIPIASGYVTALFDFTGKEENDLSFKKGDKIEVLERGDGPNDWWVGRVNGAVGEFPGNYVKET